MTDFDTIWRAQDETTEQRGPSELARRWPSRDGVRKNFKQRSSEGHPSLLEDGRVAMEFERISNNGAARAIQACSKMAESRRSSKEFQIRTVVNAVLGECIWSLSYNERRMAIELELTKYLEEEDVDALICQFPVPADYDGAGSKGTKFVFYL